MSAPVDIVVLGPTSHLADGDQMRTWCDRSIVGGVTFEMTPGSDFGSAPKDCPECAEKLQKAGK